MFLVGMDLVKSLLRGREVFSWGNVPAPQAYWTLGLAYMDDNIKMSTVIGNITTNIAM